MSFYKGTIYNGNEDITVTGLTIKITTKVDTQEATSLLYIVKEKIPPRSAKEVSFEILPGDERANYTWHIEKAVGY